MAATRRKPASPLDKRVPRNQRYADVSSRLDTGLTVAKVRTISTKEYLRRKNEKSAPKKRKKQRTKVARSTSLKVRASASSVDSAGQIFLRLTPPQLYELFAEYEADAHEDLHAAGAADGPRIVCHTEDEMPSYERPYLIVDIRPAEDFRRGHILQARSFPASLLRQDKMMPELFAFRNKEGSLIILYDDNERTGDAAAAATLLVERGFDNIFVLTKGIAEFADRFPSFVEGEAPEKPPPSGTGSRMGTAKSSYSHSSLPPSSSHSSSSTAARRSPASRSQASAGSHRPPMSTSRFSLLPSDAPTLDASLDSSSRPVSKLCMDSFKRCKPHAWSSSRQESSKLVDSTACPVHSVLVETFVACRSWNRAGSPCASDGRAGEGSPGSRQEHQHHFHRVDGRKGVRSGGASPQSDEGTRGLRLHDRRAGPSAMSRDERAEKIDHDLASDVSEMSVAESVISRAAMRRGRK